MRRLLYLLPVHNEQVVLGANVARLLAYLERFTDAEVFLLENGSRDTSWALCEALASRPRVQAFRETSAGIGYAYHRGLTEALARYGPDRDTWAIMTAADLPFGFTDLEAALGEMDRGRHRMLMGSKAHRDSVVDRGLKRAAVSAAYRAARRAILGMRVGDSQGSMFVRLDLASEIIGNVEARGFFYSTELCHYAERAGETIMEIPVRLSEGDRASNVRAVKHGREMLAQLVNLRKRTRRRTG